MEEKLKNLPFGTALIINLILSVVYYFSLYDNGSALENQIQATKTQLTASENELENLKKAVEDAERFKQTMATLGTEMERILLAIPSQLTSMELMKIISTEAKSVGVDIKNLAGQAGTASSAKDTKQFYEAVTVEVTISGSYNQVMMFLSNLTRLDKILIAKNLTLDIAQMGPAGSNSPVINMKGLIEAYRYMSETATEGGTNVK